MGRDRNEVEDEESYLLEEHPDISTSEPFLKIKQMFPNSVLLEVYKDE